MTSKKVEISDEDIIEAYERLGSLRLAAEYLGVGKDTVSRRLRRAGVNTGATKLPVGKKVEDSTSGTERVIIGKGIRSLSDLLEQAGVDPLDVVDTSDRFKTTCLKFSSHRIPSKSGDLSVNPSKSM